MKDSRPLRFASDQLFTAFALQIYEDEILDRCTHFATKEQGRIVAQDVADSLSASQAERYYWPTMGHLRGSDAYFANRRTYVESLTAMIGPCTWMLTLGPKEKEWMDLVVMLMDREYVADHPAATMQDRMQAIDAQLDDLHEQIRRELQELDGMHGPQLPAKKHASHTMYSPEALAKQRWLAS